MFKQTLVSIFLFISIFSSQAILSPVRFSFEKFSYNDKLPSNSVIRIYNDKEGYMWFGTKDGLCRFDGYDMKIFRSSALTPGNSQTMKSVVLRKMTSNNYGLELMKESTSLTKRITQSNN
ncbi:MAG: two-component regulator propeller domain-containing protein [Paludibacter sp.]